MRLLVDLLNRWFPSSRRRARDAVACCRRSEAPTSSSSPTPIQLPANATLIQLLRELHYERELRRMRNGSWRNVKLSGLRVHVVCALMAQAKGCKCSPPDGRQVAVKLVGANRASVAQESLTVDDLRTVQPGPEKGTYWLETTQGTVMLRFSPIRF